MSFKSQIDLSKMPEHVAIIMDGNGRWAKSKGMSRVQGHHAGVKSVREVTEAAVEVGIKHLTLYAFSTENWSRPKEEVDALMGLLVETIQNELSTLTENKVRLNTIGNLDDLPVSCQRQLIQAMEETSTNDRMDLNLALSYSSRSEITKAVQRLASDVQSSKLALENIDEGTLSTYLNTSGMPDPELLIRTSGEKRVSNFLLWQIAYAELYFTPIAWPDFGKEDLYSAIVDYQKRERRFGKTSEQVKQV